MQYKFIIELPLYPNATKLEQHNALHDLIDAITNEAEVIDFEEVAE